LKVKAYYTKVGSYFGGSFARYLVEYHVFYFSVYGTTSASARISKGQGYQGFLRERAGSSFGQKRAICILQGKTFKMRKTDRISVLSGSIKCFSIS
jgi:hypothetical protein